MNPFPSPSPEGRRELLEDIREHGMIYPVVHDQHGNIIDGFTRTSIAAELGIKCPVITVEVASVEERDALSIALNTLRRHLGRKQRADAMQKLRNLGWTIQRIAEVTDTPTSTVGRNTEPLDISQMGNVTDTVGRKRSSGRPRKPPITPEPEAVEEEPDLPGVPIDVIRYEVTRFIEWARANGGLNEAERDRLLVLMSQAH